MVLQFLPAAKPPASAGGQQVIFFFSFSSQSSNFGKASQMAVPDLLAGRCLAGLSK